MIQQSTDMPHSDQDNKAQGSEVDRSLSESRLELTRMDQSIATVSNRPMYPPPGLEDPNHVTEHATVLGEVRFLLPERKLAKDGLPNLVARMLQLSVFRPMLSLSC